VNVAILGDRAPIDATGRTKLMARERVLAIVDDRLGRGPTRFDPGTVRWLMTQVPTSLFAIWSPSKERVIDHKPRAPQPRVARPGRKPGGARCGAFVVLIVTASESEADWLALLLRARTGGGFHAAR
jgi:hypothetical protein